MQMELMVAKAEADAKELVAKACATCTGNEEGLRKILPSLPTSVESSMGGDGSRDGFRTASAADEN